MTETAEFTRWFFRGSTDNAHRVIGKSLGLSEVSDSDRLHESVRTEDGQWTLWDCDDIPFDRIRSIFISARKRGYEVVLYKQVGEGLPERWQEDEEVRKALENHPGREKGKAAARAAAKKLGFVKGSALRPPAKKSPQKRSAAKR